MMKQIPDGMYFDCANAVRRNAENVVKKFLAKLSIRSAKSTSNYYTGSKATVYLSGQPIAYATGIVFNLAIGDPDDAVTLDYVDSQPTDIVSFSCKSSYIP